MYVTPPTHPHPNCLFFGNPSLTWIEHSNHNNQQLLAMYVQTEYTILGRISTKKFCVRPGPTPPPHLHSNLGFFEKKSLQSPLVHACKHCSILTTHAVEVSMTPYYMYNIYHPFEFSASRSVTSDRLTELLTDEDSLDVTPPLG